MRKCSGPAAGTDDGAVMLDAGPTVVPATARRAPIP